MTAQTWAGWGFLLVFLTVAADIPATESLAVAFAYLILVAVLLRYGPEAFAWITAVTTGVSPAAAAAGGGGGQAPKVQ